VPLAQGQEGRARQLFIDNCSRCHGENGDGHGTAELDRPARSFQDGGFSFGNTPEALFRTISVGIPGTPMPAFDASLSEADRHLVASYVVTLGPPIEEVKVEDTILPLGDRPLFVRGLLPEIAEGCPRRPRGLLLGTPAGITFEYRTDDLRLLGLRLGGFVQRTDWTGRGGTALKPLGQVVHLVEGGQPESSFYLAGQPLAARLASTEVAGLEARLEYRLLEGGRERARVLERPEVVTAAFGSGYRRRLSIAGSGEVSVRTPAFDGAVKLAGGGAADGLWQVLQPQEGAPVLVRLLAPGARETLEVGRNAVEARLFLESGRELELDMTTLVLPEWNEEVGTQLLRWAEERK